MWVPHVMDVVDLPIMRERITGFPVIPAAASKASAPHARETSRTEIRRAGFIQRTPRPCLCRRYVKEKGEENRSATPVACRLWKLALAFPSVPRRVLRLLTCPACWTIPADTARHSPSSRGQRPRGSRQRMVVTPGGSEEYALDQQPNSTGHAANWRPRCGLMRRPALAASSPLVLRSSTTRTSSTSSPLH